MLAQQLFVYVWFFVFFSCVYLIYDCLNATYTFTYRIFYCMSKRDPSLNDLYAPILINNIFAGNAAQRAAGVGGDAYCKISCDYCKFFDNIAAEKGGAIYLDYSCELTLNESQFVNNYAYESGGCVNIDGSSSANIYNGEFTGNGAQMEAGCLYAGSHIEAPNAFTIVNGEFSDNHVDNNAGYGDIWLWHGNTVVESSNSNTGGPIPTYPGTSEDTGGGTGGNSGTETGNTGNTGTRTIDNTGDSSDSGGSSGSSANNSGLTGTEWIIVGVSCGVVVLIIIVGCIIRQRNKNKADGNFTLLGDDNASVSADGYRPTKQHALGRL